ncbi:MAG: hypothetical protein DWQ35_07810 [Planctomycetota bacterium]|nr:MAG: hypothetical protein DWQ35_07810 [Planctomycetota bacterium]
MISQADRLRGSWVDGIIFLFVIGYLTMGRSFAYIGWAPVFIGEVGLGSILIARYSALIGTWLTALTRPTPLSAAAWMTFAWAFYGALTAWRGYAAGHDLMVILKLAVLHTYPFFLFVGVWVGVRRPNFLATAMSWLSWIVGIYGVVYCFVLQPANLGQVSASAEVTIWGQPYGPAVALLGMLCFEPRLRPMWLPLTMNSLALLALQVRASWFGLMCAIGLWAVLKGQVTRVFALALVVAGLLAVGIATDLSVPTPGRRGGELSAKAVVAQVVAPVSSSLADELTGGQHSKEVYAGTVNFRFMFWEALWHNVHSRVSWTLFGTGYGYPIWDLGPTMPKEAPELRSPHNVFMNCLSYGGWCGVLLFYLFQATLVAVLWRVYRQTGQVFGLCYIAMINVWALFDPLLGSPMGAIPYYCLLGLAMAPALSHAREHDETREHDTIDEGNTED